MNNKNVLSVRGVYNFLSSVLSQQKFEPTDFKALGVSQLSDRLCLSSWTDECYSSSTDQCCRLRVTAQFYLENKGNTSSRHDGTLTQKMQREESESTPALWPLFLSFFFFFS